MRITNFGAFVSLEPGLDGLIHISDLESGKSRCDDLYLVAEGCIDSDRDCDEKTVPIGETELKLYVKCDFCEPNKEWDETFDAIIRN